jgi:hypothetical protein
LDAKPVKGYEEIVGSLPSDERMVPEVEHSVVHVHQPFQAQERCTISFQACFCVTSIRRRARGYSTGNARPVCAILPILPVLPIPPVPPFLPILPLLPLLPR